MKSFRVLVSFIVLLLPVAGALPQNSDTKHFAKDGLSFDYANGWTIDDHSNADAQQLTLGRLNSDAQITIFAHRGRVDTPEKMAQARRVFIDPYVSSANDTFVHLGAKPERTSVNTQIGGAPAEGVRLRAVLGGEAGETAIYWLALGNRVVVLTFFGPDKELKQSASIWDMVRNSMKVEPPPPTKQPATKPSPKP